MPVTGATALGEAIYLFVRAVGIAPDAAPRAGIWTQRFDDALIDAVDAVLAGEQQAGRMSAYRFQRDGAEWSHEEWRALDRAVHRWVRVHGGSERLAATAAWASLADGDGDAALPLAGGDRYAMPPLTLDDIASAARRAARGFGSGDPGCVRSCSMRRTGSICGATISRNARRRR